MAEARTLARPYAKAAFEYARDEGALDSWLRELQLIAAVAAEPRVRGMLSDPALTSAEQAARFVELCGEELGDSRRRFVEVLAHNRRLDLAAPVLELFAEFKAQRENTVDVELLSAYEIPDEVRHRIANALGERLERDVRVRSETDPDLIGGVVIRAGDMVIDGSVRGRLNKLAEALTH